MRIKVNLQIFIFILVFIITKQIEIYSWLMLFAFIHELGHILVGFLSGMKLKALHITPFGFSITVEEYLKKEKIEIKKILIAAARPNYKSSYLLMCNSI